MVMSAEPKHWGMDLFIELLTKLKTYVAMVFSQYFCEQALFEVMVIYCVSCSHIYRVGTGGLGLGIISYSPPNNYNNYTHTHTFREGPGIHSLVYIVQNLGGMYSLFLGLPLQYFKYNIQIPAYLKKEPKGPLVLLLDFSEGEGVLSGYPHSI